MSAFSALFEADGHLFFLAKAAGITISLALCSLVLGLVLALLLTLWESVKIKPISWAATLLVTLLRGLPELLIVLFIYYGLLISSALLADGVPLHLYFTQFTLQFDWEVSPFTCGVIALGLLYAAYASQTLRGAIKAVPAGQWEAGQALGISKKDIFLRLIVPQMWRHALPGLGNQWLVLLKDTALVSLINVNDLIMQTKSIISFTKTPFTWYLLAALIYLLISLFSQFILKRIDARTSRYIRTPA